MSYATDRQISYLTSLAAREGFDSVVSAADAFGLGFKSASSLSITEASALIEWLKNGQKIVANPTSRDNFRTVASDDYKAEAAAKQVSAKEKTARIDAIMIERGLNHLTGQARRDARYTISQEINE